MVWALFLNEPQHDEDDGHPTKNLCQSSGEEDRRPPQTASITKTIFFRAVTLAQMKAPLSIQWVKKRVEDNWVSFMLRWRQKYTSKKRVEKGLKKG